jgi:hypothetical protein|tara:strand:+ start:501 stop:734 length:234 start_codon:yes stop_codon:yes gene_type:complete
MATGNKAYTSQEAGNPYFKGVVGTSSSIPSRAIMNNGSSAAVNITFADGVVAAVFMEQGRLYKISATASSASILYLY